MKKKELIPEPIILGLGTDFMFLCSIGLVFILGVSTRVGLIRHSAESIFIAIIIMIAHWLVIGVILKRNLTVARYLMLLCGVAPFLLLMLFALIDKELDVSLWIISTYLFFFGVLFTIYIWFSSDVERYIKNQNI